MEGYQTDEERFPECFNPTEISPYTRERSKPMEVLALGMMRTGTYSMMAAFKELGYTVYHMASIIKNPADAALWRRAIDAKYHGKGKKLSRAEWDGLLGDCNVAIDAPAALFMPELMEAYPECKIVIVDRDANQWLQSCRETVGSKSWSWTVFVLVILDPVVLGRWVPMVGAMMEGCFGKGGVDGDRDRVIKAYRNMYEEVRKLAPMDKRLEYRLDNGWAPLCSFLEKPVPKAAFPFINDRAQFRERFAALRNEAGKRAMRNVTNWGGILAVCAVAYFGYFMR